ncbi:putative cytochrome P450 6a14 [Melipona quadrifasciata]|uniref:Putative cytochrome P450 6a14 n=1 Tax=Melipona quadrifasciata TaxID=166423 RepID=A0A0M8ZWI2_9HYME|nr:putative cytochrome P450 6a14 [Melipona quadrifasciata]
MSNYFEILCGVAALLLAVYYYATSTFDFWKNRGVVGPRPLPYFGNIKDILFARKSVAVYVKEIYDAYKNESMIGLYSRTTPLLVICEPKLIKDVLIRDFSHFSDRGLTINEKVEPLSSHLFFLETERWRPLRNRLSPIFTSGKLREMFYLIVECSHHLEKCLDKKVGREEVIECRELAAKFTTDVIGTCAFGIEMSALADEESEFRKMGKAVFAVNLRNILQTKLKQFIPTLYNLLRLLPYQKYVPFFTKVVSETIKYRRENNIVRPDFINMLMELQKHPEKLQNIELSDTLLTAQAFVFFVAGFETSSLTITNTLYELAQNQDIQDKLREEIEEHCAKNDGELKYDDIKRMKYLDKAYKETLRMYPAGSIVTRRAQSNYIFNGTGVSIPKGTIIWIPVQGIHYDPDIYPNPQKFDPERFNEDAVAARNPMHYLPFGDGPRNCIGERFAVYQTKVGLITILRNYKVDVCDKTMIPYEIDPGSFVSSPKSGIYLKMTKIPRKCKIIS